MQHLIDALSTYVAETRKLEGIPSSTETTFYPDIKLLLNTVLKSERLPFDIITGTSEAGARRRDMPDFVLGDSSLFVGVYGEVKRADTALADLAVSTEQNDQIGRYLAQTGVVLLCNIREIGLLTCDPSYARDRRKPVPPEKRVLERTVSTVSTRKRPPMRLRPKNSGSSVRPCAVCDCPRRNPPARRGAAGMDSGLRRSDEERSRNDVIRAKAGIHSLRLTRAGGIGCHAES